MYFTHLDEHYSYSPLVYQCVACVNCKSDMSSTTLLMVWLNSEIKKTEDDNPFHITKPRPDLEKQRKAVWSVWRSDKNTVAQATLNCAISCGKTTPELFEHTLQMISAVTPPIWPRGLTRGCWLKTEASKSSHTMLFLCFGGFSILILGETWCHSAVFSMIEITK